QLLTPSISPLFPYTTLFRSEPLAEGQAAALLGIQIPSDVRAQHEDVGAQHAAPLQFGFRSFATGMLDLVEALVARLAPVFRPARSEEHTSELQSQSNLVCRL